MDKKKKLIIVVISITVAIFIFMGVTFAKTRESLYATQTNNVVNAVLSPIQRFFSDIGGEVSDFFSYLHDMKTYKEDNLALKEEVEELKNKVRELESYERENIRLRDILDLKSTDLEDRMIVCEVSAKDPGNWFFVFTIDKGSNYGIKKDDAVISKEGLVGRVSEVGSNWSKVTSIIDSKSSVGAIIKRTEETALVDGDMVLAERGKCRLDYIKSDVSIVPGDVVETSGLGGVYPKGILIGTVSEIKDDSTGYTRYAIVDTVVDFEKIREVIVIKSEE